MIHTAKGQTEEILRLKINDIKDPPILPKKPSYCEVAHFQKWIVFLGKEIKIKFNHMNFHNTDDGGIVDQFWKDIQEAFYSDIPINTLIEIFTAGEEEFHEIELPEPTLRKRRY
jgi:hypothetical protein